MYLINLKDNNQKPVFLISITKNVHDFIHNRAKRFNWIPFWLHLLTFLKTLLSKLLTFTFYSKENWNEKRNKTSEWMIITLNFKTCCLKTSIMNSVFLVQGVKFNLKLHIKSTSIWLLLTRAIKDQEGVLCGITKVEPLFNDIMFLVNLNVTFHLKKMIHKKFVLD